MSNLSDYVDNVANGIEFLQQIENDYDPRPVCWSHFESDENVWDSLCDLVPALTNDQEYPDIWFAYTDDVLDIVFETKTHLNGEPTPTFLRYIVTTGGPHIEIVANLLSERLTVEGYWGTEKCVRGIVAEGLYTHMAHYADMMCDTLMSYRPSR